MNFLYYINIFWICYLRKPNKFCFKKNYTENRFWNLLNYLNYYELAEFCSLRVKLCRLRVKSPGLVVQTNSKIHSRIRFIAKLCSKSLKYSFWCQRRSNRLWEYTERHGRVRHDVSSQYFTLLIQNSPFSTTAAEL